MWKPSLLLLGVALAVPACGPGDEDAGATGGGGMTPGTSPPPTTQIAPDKRFLRLKTGARWVYQVRDPVTGVTTMKTQTVEALEPVPVEAKKGVMAFRVKTVKGVMGRDQTISWQEDRGSMVVRHLEHSFAPGATMPNLAEWWDAYKLRLDEHPDRLKAGMSWTVTYTETHQPSTGLKTVQPRNERWTVVSVSDTVKVPAGEYKDCLQIRRVGTDSGAMSDKRYWYARGVGKVKETGGQAEELVSVSGL